MRFHIWLVVFLMFAQIFLMPAPTDGRYNLEIIPRSTPVDFKGIWVWGSTIRGYEQSFASWAVSHNYSDIFLLIKGTSGVVKYDVLNTLLTIKNTQHLHMRIHAWLVGFKDESHANTSWNYITGDWVAPDDSDYVSYLAWVVRKAVDPAMGYVSYIPDGVMLDDTFQWPSHNYGSSTSYRVQTIANAAAYILNNAILPVEQNYGVNITYGIAPHPEIGTAPDGSTYNAYEYGQDFGQLAKYVELEMPETYRYGFYGNEASWISNVVNFVKTEIASEAPGRNVLVYPATVLYWSDSNPTPVSSDNVRSDINAALSAATGFSVFRYASQSVNPGNGQDANDLPTSSQLGVLDPYYVPQQGNNSQNDNQSISDVWNTTEFGDNRDIAMWHQQPTHYNDDRYTGYEPWCGPTSVYMVLHSYVPDLPARLKAAYPTWTDKWGVSPVEADPYIYHKNSTFCYENMVVIKGIGYYSDAGYGYSELDNIIDWVNALNIGVNYEYQYVSLADMKTYLQNGWMAVMNVKTGHYVAVVAYTYDDPSDSQKRYYWVLDPWPTSYIGPGSTWSPTNPDPDGDGVNEFNVNLTWVFRRLVWSRQPLGTTSNYEGVYVMTGAGINDVFRDQLGNGKLLMIRLVSSNSKNKYVAMTFPESIPANGDNFVRSLKMVNGYLYSGTPALLTTSSFTARVTGPINGTQYYLTLPKGCVIMKGVSPYYAAKSAQIVFGYNANIFEIDMTNITMSVEALRLQRARIMLYTGNGTIYDKIQSTLEWLRFRVDSPSDPAYIDRLLDGTFRYRVIFIPGGSATDIASGIGSTRLKEIAQFVASGGGYIGVCAGSYLPVKGYNTQTSWLEIVNATVPVLNPGEGTVTISVNNSDDPVITGFTGSFQMAYYNGPALQPGGLNSSTLGLPTPYPNTLATFISGPNSVLIGKTAILSTTYGNGRIALFSPHPEHDEVGAGKYLWRLLWNAIHALSGTHVVIQPRIIFEHTPPASVTQGVDVQIEVHVHSPYPVSGIWIYYQPVNETAWYATAMTLISGNATDGNYTGIIPAQQTPGTLAYYFYAVDSTNYNATSKTYTTPVMPSIEETAHGLSFVLLLLPLAGTLLGIAKNKKKRR